MELNEFISEAILQISKGVIEAIEKCEEFDVIVNPNVMIGSNGDYIIPKETTKDIERRVQMIDMDIAVSVSDGLEKEKGHQLKIKVLEFGAKTKDSIISRTESRMKFSIPVSLPNTDSKVYKISRRKDVWRC